MELKSIKAYKKMPPEKRLEAIHEWVKSEINDWKNRLRRIAYVGEDSSSIDNILATPLEDLPTMINDHPVDSIEHELIKHRIADQVDEENAIYLLDTDWYGKKTADKTWFMADIEGVLEINTARVCLQDLQALCKILGDEELLSAAIAWKPPAPEEE